MSLKSIELLSALSTYQQHAPVYKCIQKKRTLPICRDNHHRHSLMLGGYHSWPWRAMCYSCTGANGCIETRGRRRRRGWWHKAGAAVASHPGTALRSCECGKKQKNVVSCPCSSPNFFCIASLDNAPKFSCPPLIAYRYQPLYSACVDLRHQQMCIALDATWVTWFGN